MKKNQLFKKLMSFALLFISVSGFSQVTEAWVKRHYGAGDGFERANFLVADAFGNVYVAGDNGGIRKYDAAGNQLWVKTSSVRSVAVDKSGNVYVAGYSDGAGTSLDFITTKYNAAGTQLWTRRYNGPGNRGDVPSKVVVDNLGNVYVTGSSNSRGELGGQDYDYATVKYDAAGNQLWASSYNTYGIFNGPNSAWDYPTSLTVDHEGNVYVTGYSYMGEDDLGTVHPNDFTTVKYDAAGNELWVKKFTNFVGDPRSWTDEVAKDVVVDSAGNVYVTGYHGNDCVTIKYDAHGAELWVKRLNGPGNGSDIPASLVVDGLCNLYVTVASVGNGTGYDYALIKYDAAGNELWAKRFDGSASANDKAYSMAMDASGNVYITGESPNIESGIDYTTIKYDAAGNELWVKRYNGPANGTDKASSLAVDGSGNVYVTGLSYNQDNSYDHALIKYSQTQSAAISSFTLINADTDKDIRQLKDGDTINLETLASLNLNIRANSNPATIGSVTFSLSGAERRTYTENIVPYALFADNKNGDYYAWTPANGRYTLTATPYTTAKGGGAKGTPLTITFTVTGQVVSNLMLVNADTDKDIKALKNGDVINLSELPTTNLNIRAVVHPDTVGSVVFNLNNRLIVRENILPYAIGGDIKGDYRPWTLPTGNHVLTATPYSVKKGTGKTGKAHSVTFRVTNMSTITRTNVASPQKTVAEIYSYIGQGIKATPNPFSGQTTISFSIPKSGFTTVQVCDASGVVVGHLYQAWAEGGRVYQVPFERKQLNSGVYILRVAAGAYVKSGKLVLIK